MKRIICFVLFLILTLLPVFEGPATAASAQSPSAVVHGRQLYRQGNPGQALAVLRAFVQQSADESESAEAYILIGRILADQNQYHDAILYLKRIPVHFRTAESDLLLGASLVQTGRHEEGLALLRTLIDSPFGPDDSNALFRNLVDSAMQNNRFLLALYYLQQQLPSSPRPATLLARAHDILQNRIDDSALEEAAFMWQGTEIGQDARLQLARRALVRQQSDEARQHLQQLLASPVTFPYWQEAELLLQRTGDDSWLNRDSIGVLLPLSGPYASYGELVKKGLELALKEHNRTRLPIRFIYRDSAVENVRPEQLVSTLADDDKVMAIIGPLLATNAGPAAQRAQREMVPMIALSQTDSLPEIGSFIYRDTLTAAQQVKALVDYAMKTNHISFSVLYPENRLGQRMTELFSAELQRAGGEIVDVISYPEDSTDFRKQIQKLLWIEDGQRNQADVTDPETPELEYPLAPFHALFLPDYADRISLIAPQLLFYGIKDVTLLGINGWNSPELIARAGRFLKNGIFVDAFFPESSKPEVRRFVELYRQTYGEEPSILEAQAFDTATLLLQVMDDPTVVNRDNLRKKLDELQGLRGVAGTTGFDAFGDAVKDLYLLKIKQGRIVEN